MLNRTAQFIGIVSLSLLFATAPGCKKPGDNANEQQAAQPAQQQTGGEEAAGTEANQGAQGEATGEAAGGAATETGAVATLEPKSGSNVTGTVTLTSVDGKVKVEYDLHGLSKGQYGFHIHENGDCSAPDASSAGGHFNPTNKPHGAPGPGAHVGDMGNITTDDNGNAKGEVMFEQMTLKEGDPSSVIGHAIVVHGKADDMKSQPSGNAGPRVACGVIQARAE